MEAQRDHYKQLIKGGLSAEEHSAQELRQRSLIIGATAAAPLILGGAVDLAPNIFGLADGGSHWGAAANALAWSIQIAAGAGEQHATKLEIEASQQRRNQEWKLQQTLAEGQIKQLEASLKGIDLQITMAEKQYALAETEHAHAQEIYQLQSTRFSGQALYNWMAGRLSGLYYQLFDAAQPLCLMAKSALARDTGEAKTQYLFQSSGWTDLYQGLLAGENLMLNLQKMENIWLAEEKRALEVERTVSLQQFFSEFSLKDRIRDALNSAPGQDDTQTSGVSLLTGEILSIRVTLESLGLRNDYSAGLNLGSTRRIKQISVTLPALLGPYQDVQAVLSYSGSTTMPGGCDAIALSHGMNDSGQFRLDFDDSRYLPFEGINIDDPGVLQLRFPNATGTRKALLESLTDIILHIRYTIRS